jgi:indolepyruvate decarboxylase
MSEYTVTDYLLDRLAELGVDCVFGVPGDFTLALLDRIVAHPQVSWVGCTNELNAGYAADGYGRMRGVGAVCTTFGVGELSAINALTGSFAEHVPVIEIVGAPSQGTQTAQRIVHHSLGDGVFTHFLSIHTAITCARAALTPDNARAEIDRVLTEARDQRLPGYLLLPTDVGATPTTPPEAPLPAPRTVTDPSALQEFAGAARRLLTSVGGVDDIAVLGGLLVHRFGAAADLHDLIAAGNLRHATTLWGKSLVDESHPRYLGIYSGAVSDPEVRAVIEQAPALVVAGVEFTDLNSGLFSQQITRSRTIELAAAVASVGTARYAPVAIGDALRTLVELVGELADRAPTSAPDATPTASPARAPADPASPLQQSTLWETIAAALRSGDIVLADQGTSFYGAATHRLPADVMFIGQPLWASIGYTVPALLGACLATPGRRGVLLVGDGAAQMTVQEISTSLRQGLAPIIVVVDNAGYTVERAIHGPDEPYNDIAAWNWTGLVDVFGDPGAQAHRVTTVGELHDALTAAADHPERACLIQAVVPRLDTPPLLAALARAVAAANAERGASG